MAQTTKLLLLMALLGACFAGPLVNPIFKGTAATSYHARSARDEGSEEQPVIPAFFSSGASFHDFDADYDYASGSFVVPAIPANDTLNFIEYDVMLQTAVGVGGILENGDSIVIYTQFNPEIAGWIFGACMCPSLMCNCSDDVFANPGDTVDFVIALENGVYTATATSGDQVATYSADQSQFAGPLGLFGSQMPVSGGENCNNLPPTGSIPLTNIVVKNRGAQVAINTDIWEIFYVISACSLRVVANEVAILIGWNSNDWTGSKTECSVAVIQSAESSWTQNGQKVTQYTAHILNYATFDVLNGLKVKFNGQPSQLWGLDANEDGSYSIPAYAFPMNPIADYSFGYISSKRITVVDLDCDGGEPLAIGEQPGFESIDEDDSPTPGNEGCEVSFSSSIVSSWTANDQAYSQVNVVISNSGSRAVTSLSFNGEGTISQIWGAASLNGGGYSLPEWISSLAVGGSHSFGYIAQSSSAIDFQATQITCS